MPYPPPGPEAALGSLSLPARPLVVRPPGAGVGAQLATILWSLVGAAALLWLVITPVGDLVTDYGLAGAARPVPEAHVEGSCSVHLAVLTTCSATLTAPGPGGTPLTRKVDYFFVDFHAGSYSVEVFADPARPALLTTDLALDKLWNRILTLALLGPLFAVFALLVVSGARQQVRGQRATRRALSNQVLRPALLRLDGYVPNHWTVSPLRGGQLGPARTWPVPNDARPIVLDPANRLVLGVTAGDGTVVMPVDNRLRWLGLSGDERRGLLDALGPDRLGRWLAALATPASQAEGRRLRRRARSFAVVGVVLAAMSGGAAWLAFGPPASPGEPLVLTRGDEAARTAAVRLEGVQQLERVAQTSRDEGNTAHLEVWAPVTAPGWTPEQPVTWIVKNVTPSLSATGPVRLSGTVSETPLPDRARVELERKGVVLASPVRVLDALPQVENPLYFVELAACIFCGLLGLILLVAALVLRARAHRLDALLR